MCLLRQEIDISSDELTTLGGESMQVFQAIKNFARKTVKGEGATPVTTPVRQSFFIADDATEISKCFGRSPPAIFVRQWEVLIWQMLRAWGQIARADARRTLL